MQGPHLNHEESERPPAGPPGSRLIRDERGVALVLALLILVTLTVLGIGGMFSASTDTAISGNQKGTAQALYAAEAGISDLIDKLNTDAAYTPGTPYSTTWAPADLTGTVNTFGYTVRVRHKLDDEDCDGDSVTNEIVKYDKACYPSSPLPAGSASSYPVEVVTSTASLGKYQNTTLTEVTKQRFTYKTTGALTAQSDVDLNGDIEIDGNTHDINGNPSATPCGGALPSVTTTTGNDVTLTGSPEADPAPVNTMTDAQQPDDPCEALGLASDCETTTLSAYVVTAANVDPMNKSIRWVQGNYADSCLDGTGILIVHTPGFDPQKCNAASAEYDAAWCAAHPPANLGNITGNCTFKGLIIADKIDKLAGTGTIIGAVISFTEIQADKVGAGTMTLKYSCAALDEFGGGKINHKLAWERQ
jgi:Tfp pilus assembly protein PilX